MLSKRWSPHGIVFAGKRRSEVPVIIDELPPPNGLESYVQAYWSMAWDLPTGIRIPVLAVPSGSFNLIFNRDYPKQWQAYLTGVRTTAYPFELIGKGRMTGVRFTAGGFSAFYAKPIAMLVNQSISIGLAIPQFDDGNVEKILATRTLEEFKHILDPLLASSVIDQNDEDFQVLDGFFRYIADIDQPQVGDIINELKTSDRKVQRLFERRVGVSPKMILRTKRFQSVANSLLAGGNINWADFALEMGYYDQSHFINDFRMITGWLPQELQRQPEPVSFFSNNEKANLDIQCSNQDLRLELMP